MPTRGMVRDRRGDRLRRGSGLVTVRSWRLAHPGTIESIKTIAAITRLRDSTGMTLREAKDAVDQL
ncbi:hypothetical protein [Rhodococcus jostii]|uniref:hypothetical protein n=1 Tax=Rhodococcus jostii TaxID=132919 RepID=UPI003640F669